MQSPTTSTILVRIVNSWRALLAIYALTVLAGASAFHLLEGRNFGESLWWVFITGLTIGYGDVYPATAGGRILGIVLAHLIIMIIIPMVITYLLGKVNEDRFSHSEQEDLKSQLATTNAKLDAVISELNKLTGNEQS